MTMMKKMRYKGNMLKMILFVGIVFSALLSPFSLHAQKYACVNTDYVLRSIPDYANAQKRLDKYVADWTKELNDKNDELAAMRSSYEQESYLLPENLKQRRQEEIKAAEQELKALQQQRFGSGGDLDKKRTELLKPIQDRVYTTIERLVQEKNYAMVFDKAGSPAVLFVNKKYDISDEVLELLGIHPNASSTPATTGGTEEAKKPANPEMRSPMGNSDRVSKSERATKNDRQTLRDSKQQKETKRN